MTPVFRPARQRRQISADAAGHRTARICENRLFAGQRTRLQARGAIQGAWVIPEVPLFGLLRAQGRGRPERSRSGVDLMLARMSTRQSWHESPERSSYRDDD